MAQVWALWLRIAAQENNHVSDDLCHVTFLLMCFTGVNGWLGLRLRKPYLLLLSFDNVCLLHCVLYFTVDYRINAHIIGLD